MKKRSLFGFLNKAQAEPERVHVYGISAAEYSDIQNALDAELGAAAARQRAGATEPSPYMKGLLYAIKLLCTVQPHDLEVQQ